MTFLLKRIRLESDPEPLKQVSTIRYSIFYVCYVGIHHAYVKIEDNDKIGRCKIASARLELEAYKKFPFCCVLEQLF